MIAYQQPLFDIVKPKAKVCRGEMITTVNHDQQAILKNIIALYLGGKTFDCDPTFSKGVIWDGLSHPPRKYDIKPQAPGVVEASATSLPLADASLNSIFYDPPFLIRTGKGSVIKDRFSDFPSIAELWQFYRDSLVEFHRVLKHKGIVAFKCQDLISSGEQVASQYEIMRMAFDIGYRWMDTFILVSDHPIVSPQRQKHARKIHSYFIVFQKFNKREKVKKE